MDIKTEIIMDHGTEDYQFSLKKQKYIIVGDVRHDVGAPVRCAVSPGDFDLLETFIYTEQEQKKRNIKMHPIEKTLRELWTPEVIETFRAKFPLPEVADDD